MSGRGRQRAVRVAVLVVVAVLAGIRALDSTPARDDVPRAADGPASSNRGVGDDATALAVPVGERTWTGTVVHVSDGDTLIARVDDPRGTALRAGEEVRVRLLRINTPELTRDGKPAGCWADEAKRALEALVPDGSSATFQYDLEAQDQYGRELAHVWTADGIWANGRLLLDGHATVVTYRPNVDHEDLVRQLEARAEQAGAGLWAACPR